MQSVDERLSEELAAVHAEFVRLEAALQERIRHEADVRATGLGATIAPARSKRWFRRGMRALTTCTVAVPRVVLRRTRPAGAGQAAAAVIDVDGHVLDPERPDVAESKGESESYQAQTRSPARQWSRDRRKARSW